MPDSTLIIYNQKIGDDYNASINQEISMERCILRCDILNKISEPNIKTDSNTIGLLATKTCDEVGIFNHFYKNSQQSLLSIHYFMVYYNI
jgi:hypothetical protein